MLPNEDTKAFVRAKLDKIREGSSWDDELQALVELFQALSPEHEETDKIQDLKDYLVAQGAFDVLVEASKRGYNHAYFLRGIVSTFCVLVENSTERSMAAMSSGIVPNIVETMKSYSSDTCLMTACLGALNSLLRILPVENMASIAESVTDISVKTLEACEANKESVMLFVLACVAMHKAGCGPGVEISEELNLKMVQVVWNGMTHHAHDQDAQVVGRQFLRHLVGPERAKDMIECSELHHARHGSNCSAAA